MDSWIEWLRNSRQREEMGETLSSRDSPGDPVAAAFAATPTADDHQPSPRSSHHPPPGPPASAAAPAVLSSAGDDASPPPRWHSCRLPPSPWRGLGWGGHCYLERDAVRRLCWRRGGRELRDPLLGQRRSVSGLRRQQGPLAARSGSACSASSVLDTGWRFSAIHSGKLLVKGLLSDCPLFAIVCADAGAHRGSP
jgi:hypothetical protein